MNQNIEISNGIIDDAGWHFSWTGGAARLKRKMDAFSHTEAEFQRWNNEDLLSTSISSQSFFFDSEPLINLCLKNGFPTYLCKNKSAFLKKGFLSPNYASGIPYKTDAEHTPRLRSLGKYLMPSALRGFLYGDK